MSKVRTYSTIRKHALCLAEKNGKRTDIKTESYGFDIQCETPETSTYDARKPFKVLVEVQSVSLITNASYPLHISGEPINNII